jgi:hypothetical protein
VEVPQQQLPEEGKGGGERGWKEIRLCLGKQDGTCQAQDTWLGMRWMLPEGHT